MIKYKNILVSFLSVVIIIIFISCKSNLTDNKKFDNIDVSEKDKYMTETVPEGKPMPVEPQDSLIGSKELTCTLSVKCDTILENLSLLDREKVDIVPKDGIIYAEKTIVFYEGESVFNVLHREMKKTEYIFNLRMCRYITVHTSRV